MIELFGCLLFLFQHLTENGEKADSCPLSGRIKMQGRSGGRTGLGAWFGGEYGEGV